MADYFVEGGDVLENKLGITDSEQLREAEEDAFSDAATDILAKASLFDLLKNSIFISLSYVLFMVHLL